MELFCDGINDSQKALYEKFFSTANKDILDYIFAEAEKYSKQYPNLPTLVSFSQAEKEHGLAKRIDEYNDQEIEYVGQFFSQHCRTKELDSIENHCSIVVKLL